MTTQQNKFYYRRCLSENSVPKFKNQLHEEYPNWQLEKQQKPVTETVYMQVF